MRGRPGRQLPHDRCTHGVVSEDISLRPHLLVAGSHINATGNCIIADGIAQAMILGCLLYGSLLAEVATAGVLIRGGTRWFSIADCQFENTSTTEDFSAILVEDGEDGIIDDNVFRSGTTAIWLVSGAERVRIGSGNVYGALANRILNQGTNNYAAPNVVAGIADVADNATVSFGFNFQNNPVVTLTHIGTSTGLGYAAVDITTTGFTLRHSNGSTPTLFGWTAVGL